VPTRRPIPLLALWLERDPAAFVDAQAGLPARGTYIVPHTPAVARAYILDKRDRDRRVPRPPPAFEPQRANAAWELWARC
jgi:hypothetical protein